MIHLALRRECMTRNNTLKKLTRTPNYWVAYDNFDEVIKQS